MLIDEVKAALDANARLISLAPDMAHKLIAAEEMAEAIADNDWRTDAEKAALTAYRKAGEKHAD